MKEDEECDYDRTLIDDSSAQGCDKEICNVEGENSNMCNDVVLETKLIQSQVETFLHEDVELQMSFNKLGCSI